MLWLCLRAPRWTWRVASKHDFSYGVYLYAFPVQLLLTVLGAARFGFLQYLALSVIATAPFAMASWFLVERPALRLKNRGPGRIGRVPGPVILSEPQPATEAS